VLALVIAPQLCLRSYGACVAVKVGRAAMRSTQARSRGCASSSTTSGTSVRFQRKGIAWTSWHPGQPEAGAQVVEVTFTADGTHTRVDLEHREWERAGANAEFLRGRFAGGWQPLLERFAALSRGETMLPVEGPGCCLPGS
jgi:hypothetical protein